MSTAVSEFSPVPFDVLFDADGAGALQKFSTLLLQEALMADASHVVIESRRVASFANEAGLDGVSFSGRLTRTGAMLADVGCWALRHQGEQKSGFIPTGSFGVKGYVNRKLEAVEMTRRPEESRPDIILSTLSPREWFDLKVQLDQDPYAGSTGLVHQGTLFLDGDEIRLAQLPMRETKDPKLTGDIWRLEDSRRQNSLPRVARVSFAGNPSSSPEQRSLKPTGAEIELLGATVWLDLNVGTYSNNQPMHYWSCSILPFIADVYGSHHHVGAKGSGTLTTVGFTVVDDDGEQLLDRTHTLAIREAQRLPGLKEQAFQIFSWGGNEKKPAIVEVGLPPLPSHLAWPRENNEKDAVEEIEAYAALLAGAMTAEQI